MQSKTFSLKPVGLDSSTEDGIYESEIILDSVYSPPTDLNQSIFVSAKEFEVKGIKNWFSSKKGVVNDSVRGNSADKSADKETVDINSYNKLQQELEDTKKQNVELNSRITALTTKIDELTNKFTAITPKLNIQAQELGVIGEDTLMKMFSDVGLKVEVKAKVPHVSDLWGIDEAHKILFVIESKNKNVITAQDIEKFKYDLNYIAKNKLQPKDFTIVGLFVSLRTKVINQTIGGCNFSYTETYIGNQCLSQEFLKMYISTIRTLKGVYDHDQTEYKRILESVTEKYNSMNIIVGNLNAITNSAQEIIKSANDAKKLLDTTCDNLKESMIKLNTPETELIKAEKRILDYLKKTSKAKIKMTTVKELANGLPVFGGKRLTKAFCEELMNQ
jgi:predicted  nucleic acid-binding Zn-ribbon protein